MGFGCNESPEGPAISGYPAELGCWRTPLTAAPGPEDSLVIGLQPRDQLPGTRQSAVLEQRTDNLLASSVGIRQQASREYSAGRNRRLPVTGCSRRWTPPGERYPICAICASAGANAL